MSFLLITLISSCTALILFRIGKWELSIVPAFFVLLYSGDFITQLSFKSISYRINREHGALLSRTFIMIGILLLWHSQSVYRSYSAIATVSLTTLLFIISYHTDYKEWKYVFWQWMLVWWLLLIGTWRWYWGLWLETLLSLATRWSIQLFVIRYGIYQFYEKDPATEYNKEIRWYMSIYLLIYQIFSYNILIVIVVQLWCNTFLIALRQHFITYQLELNHEKQEWLNGRALLEWQKVLQRFKDKQDNKYSIMSTLLDWWWIPSKAGLESIQILQWIQIILLISISGWQLYNGVEWTLLRYRLWVACFVITLFCIDRQDKLFWRYKKSVLMLVNGAIYITLFSQELSRNTIVLRSLSRNCINMFTCLFYNTIVSESKRILNRNDLLFWMLWTNVTTIITLLSLVQTQLSGDVLFALGCIIIGCSWFFSYHIWKKYSSL